MMRVLVCLLTLLSCPAAAHAAFIEPETLKEKVATGELPPIEARLPEKPLRVDFAGRGKAPGKYGGTLRMLIGGQRNISSVTVSGYARLVGYDENLSLKPDILESFQVEGKGGSLSASGSATDGRMDICSRRRTFDMRSKMCS